jgi:hypothetical protein
MAGLGTARGEVKIDFDTEQLEAAITRIRQAAGETVNQELSTTGAD